MPWPAIVAAGLTVGGALGSGAIKRGQALRDWDRVNAYNHPKEQIKRLREAGLPLATMFGGQGGSTAGAVPDSELDPTLGVAEGIQNFQMVRMQKKQMELMDAQIYAEKGKGAREWVEALRAKTQADKEMNEVYGFQLVPEGMENIDSESNIYMPGTNQVQALTRQRDIQKAEVKGAELANDILGIKKDLTEEQMRAEIDRILIDIKMKQGYAELRDKVINDMKVGGTGLEGLKRLLTLFIINKGGL